MARASEIRVPDIGDFAEIPVIEVHVAAGDSVAVEDPLVTLESDKATMDVPSPLAGTVGELRVRVGDRVSEGSVLLLVEAAADGVGVQATGTETTGAETTGAEPTDAAATAATRS